MPFELRTIDTPRYLIQVLPLFQDNQSFTNAEFVDATAAIGLSESPRRTRHLTTHWFLLGLLDRTKCGSSFKYALSSYGAIILDNLRFGPSLAIELVHWTWYSGFLRAPVSEWGASWLYQQLSDLIWENSPARIVANKLLANMVELANSTFPDNYPSFNITSITSVIAWLSELDPPFLSKGDPDDPGRNHESNKRQYCSPELVLLAIQLQYTVKRLPFGVPLLMDDELIDSISKICLLDSNQFWPMAEICALTFPKLSRKETAYGTSLSISEPAEFTPPTPRALKSTTSQENR